MDTPPPNTHNTWEFSIAFILVWKAPLKQKSSGSLGDRCPQTGQEHPKARMETTGPVKALWTTGSQCSKPQDLDGLVSGEHTNSKELQEPSHSWDQCPRMSIQEGFSVCPSLTGDLNRRVLSISMVMHPGGELVGSARNRPQAPVRSPARQPSEPAGVHSYRVVCCGFFPPLFYSTYTSIFFLMNEIVIWSEPIIHQKMQIKYYVLHKMYSLCLRITRLLCLCHLGSVNGWWTETA